MSSVGNQRKQSRIVIDVDRVQQEASQRRRRGGGRRRTLSIAGLILLAVILALLVGGYLWWQSFRTSPAYSLALLVDAAQRNDMPAVDQLIDTDSVTRSLVPQVIDSALARIGGAGAVAAPRRQIEAALPQMLPYARDEVRTQIAEGVRQVAGKTGGRMPFPLLALAVPRTWESISDGDERGEQRDAFKTILFKTEGRDLTLVMRRDGERWKVAGVRDEQLAAGIAARVVGSLPSSNTAAPRRQR